MSPIEAALTAIKSLQPGEQFSYSKIAIEHGVVRTTLMRRHRLLTTTRASAAQNQQAIHPHQEEELVRYIEGLTDRGIPPTRALIRNLGSSIAKKQLGKKLG